jgi:hypothetical protein
MHRPALAACVFGFLAFQALAGSDELSGDWKGTWIQNADAVSVTETFTKSGDGYMGTFDSDALQVAGIPFSDITQDPGKVHFQLKGDQTTTVFDGVVKGDLFSGTFTDGSSKGHFDLTRTTLPSAQVHERDVSFHSKDADHTFTIVDAAHKGGWPKHEPDYAETLVNWALAQR